MRKLALISVFLSVILMTAPVYAQAQGFFGPIRNFFSNLLGGEGCAGFSITDPGGEENFQMPDGFVGVPYEANLSVRFSSGNAKFPISWSLQAPPELDFAIRSSGDGFIGTISGVPFKTGSYKLLIQAKDSCPNQPGEAEKEMEVTVKPAPAGYCAPLQIYNENLPAGTVGKPYSGQLQTGLPFSDSGDPIPGRVYKIAKWAFTPFPAQEGQSVSAKETLGLKLNQNGLLSGVPTRAGIYDLLVQVEHQCPKTVERTSKSVGIIIAPSEDLSQIKSGETPSGPNLIQKAEGTARRLFDGAVKAITAILGPADNPLLPDGACQPLEISTHENLKSAAFGEPYNASIEATGGAGKLIWTWLSEEFGPIGLNFSFSGGNAFFEGTPNRTGDFVLQVRVSDSCPAGAQSQVKNFQLTVSQCPDIEIRTSGDLRPGLVGKYYFTNIELVSKDPAQKIREPIDWELFFRRGGELPPGLQFVGEGNAAAIYGTPEKDGNYLFTLNANDSCPNVHTASKDFFLKVHNEPICPPLSAQLDRLPDAIVDQGYFQLLTAQGGREPFKWISESGILPPGMKFSPDGIVSGVPTVAGEYHFAATVQDSCPTGIQTQTGNPVLRVLPSQPRIPDLPPPGREIPSEPSGAKPKDIMISPDALSDGTELAAYSEILYPINAVSRQTKWKLISGSLPSGLNLKTNQDGTGLIDGKLADGSKGQYSFVVEVTEELRNPDGTPATRRAHKEYLMGVGKLFTGVPRCSPLKILAELPNAIVGQPYGPVGLPAKLADDAHERDMYFPPLKWRVVSGKLPDGLRLQSFGGGDIRGTPIKSVEFDPAFFTFVLGVTDSSIPLVCSPDGREESRREYTMIVLPEGSSVSKGDNAKFKDIPPKETAEKIAERISLPRAVEPPPPTPPTFERLIRELLRRIPLIPEITIEERREKKECPPRTPCPEEPEACSLEVFETVLYSCTGKNTKPCRITKNSQALLDNLSGRGEWLDRDRSTAQYKMFDKNNNLCKSKIF